MIIGHLLSLDAVKKKKDWWKAHWLTCDTGDPVAFCNGVMVEKHGKATVTRLLPSSLDTVVNLRARSIYPKQHLWLWHAILCLLSLKTATFAHVWLSYTALVWSRWDAMLYVVKWAGYGNIRKFVSMPQKLKQFHRHSSVTPRSQSWLWYTVLV